MADQKISAMTAVVTPALTDELPVVQGGANKKETLAQAQSVIFPVTTLGDLGYGGASGVPTRLAGNTAATNKFLRQIGNGSVSAAPSWETIAVGDLPTSAKARVISALFINPEVADQAWVLVPYDCTVNSWEVVADVSGSIVIDVWHDTYANWPPTVADTIAGTEKPTLSSAIKNQDTSLTTWASSAQLTGGNYLIFNIDSISTVTKVLVLLKATIR